MAQNNGRIVEYHTNPRGFIYDVATGQRFLKSSANGFAASDKSNTTAKTGLIDWTDGVTQITWAGSQRYSEPTVGKKLFKKGKEFDFNGLIVGKIAGAAFKNNRWIVFSVDAGILHYYFFDAQETQLTTGSIGTYDNLLQIVAISADCTKAAFIAVPVGQWRKETVLVDLTISLTDKTITISSEITQDIDIFVDYAHVDHNTQSLPNTELDYLASYSRDTTRIICAVDFDRENTRKTFFIESNFTFSKAEMQVYSNYIVAEFNTIDYTTDKTSSFQAVINYNDFVTCTFDFSSINTVVKHWQGGVLVEFADPQFYADFGDYDPPQHDILADTLSDSADFLMIHFLDLRYDIFCYTRNFETITGTNSSYDTSILRTYTLKISGFETSFKTDTATDVVAMYDMMFVDSTPQHNLTIPLQFNPYFFNLPIENGLLDYAVGEGIVDLYKNKLIKAHPISLDRDDDAIFIKIDKNNILYENGITALRGVI